MNKSIKSITMTDEQTEMYDDDGSEAASLLAELRAEAQQIIDNGDAFTVEIYTADGIVADVVQ
mgnify:CR=1 FL=1